MLRLPNRGRYALIALLDVVLFSGHDAAREPGSDAASGRLGAGSRGGARPAQTREIAARQRIPLRFLEQIFQDLKRAKLVVGKRGPGGGFLLSRAPADIRVGDVLRAACGPMEIAHEGGARTSELGRMTDHVLMDVGRRVEQCFDELTLEELSQRGRNAGIGVTGGERVRYAI